MRRLLATFLLLLLVFSLIFDGLTATTMLLPFSVKNAYSSGHIILQPILNDNNNSSKVIILGFDDSPKSQFTLASITPFCMRQIRLSESSLSCLHGPLYRRMCVCLIVISRILGES